MLVKLYGGLQEDPERRYSPEGMTFTRKLQVAGAPDMQDASTSHVERHNLTTRMSVSRFTRLTNAFSKKIENHGHALALYFVWYNFCRVHLTLRKTPAMAAGLAEYPYGLDWIVRLIEARTPLPGPRGTYKSAVSN